MFRASPLRNVALTAPYFHSGEVWDLKQAVAIMGSSQLGHTLTDDEAGSIARFLETLTGIQPKVEPDAAGQHRDHAEAGINGVSRRRTGIDDDKGRCLVALSIGRRASGGLVRPARGPSADASASGPTERARIDHQVAMPPAWNGQDPGPDHPFHHAPL